jgi:HlyD family secretion protein
MATIATPRRRVRFSRKVLIWGGVILALVVICAVAGMLISNAMSAAAQTAATSGWKTETAQTGPIDASVSATGNIEPRAQAELRFIVDGTVTAVLVKPGDRVEAGQPLARVDDTDLKLKLDQAQADLKQAIADRADLMDGATPQEIASAQARVAQAQAQYQQTAGSVTTSDVAAARARLDAAKATLAAIQAGHTDAHDAEMALQQSQTRLQSQRDQLSAAKTSAQIQMEQRVNDLTRAQSSYSTAKQNWDYAQETGRDPLNVSVDAKTGKKVHAKIGDQQRQQYYDAFVQAETAMHNAEAALRQAQVEFDNARQAEVTGVQTAEQDVASAQSKLDALRAGGASQQLAAAQADVASAQAELNRLTGANRSGNLEGAKAGITIAQQDLDTLMADPSASALARAEAAVVSAEVVVKQAQRALDQATLKAPFAATIARVGLRAGEVSVGSTSSTSSATNDGVVVIADLSSFHIDLPVDELDVVQIAAGQPVRIALDALPDAELTGKVTNVEPLATQTDRGTNTYNVTIEIDSSATTLRSGMTATVQIITQRKPDAVLVPRRAVQAEGGTSYVLIPKEGPPDLQNSRPASERRNVTLGLSNGEFIEIVSGLRAGEQVLVQDVVQTFNPVND